MTTYIVIACGDDKVDHAAPARDLYIGSAFRHFLNAATREAAATERDLGIDCEVLILSALHGLVRLDDVLEPYNQKMGRPGSITPEEIAQQMTDMGITYGPDEVYAMLPKSKGSPYLPALDAASDIAEGPWVQDIYEAAPGIGYQRGVASVLIRRSEVAA